MINRILEELHSIREDKNLNLHSKIKIAHALIRKYVNKNKYSFKTYTSNVEIYDKNNSEHQYKIEYFISSDCLSIEKKGEKNFLLIIDEKNLELYYDGKREQVKRSSNNKNLLIEKVISRDIFKE